ncbi:MAG TPA: MlaD family protein, partial [Bacteroidales bacterium]|nr:MlaD family protein [Bacteroidales bacterium]
MKITREFKIGIIAVIILALFFWGLSFLKGRNLFKSTTELYAVYHDVAGLSESNPVLLSGLKVGQVNTIEFVPGTTDRLVVEFDLTAPVDLPKDTKAQIISSDLIGTKAINLVPGKSTVFAADGDTLAAEVKLDLIEQLSDEIEPLTSKVGSVINSLDSILLVTHQIMNEKTRNDIEQSIANVRETSDSLNSLMKEQKSRLGNIFKNVESISNNLKDNNEQITYLMHNLADISDSIARSDLKATIDQTAQVMSSTSDILRKINNGEGSLGMLLENDSLYNNLESASGNLDKLLI